MFFMGFGLHFLEKMVQKMLSANKTQTQTRQHFVFVYLCRITVFTASKPLKLFISLEKYSVSWLGLGLGLVKVVGFTAFKLLKMLVSLEKSPSCLFHCCETA